MSKTEAYNIIRETKIVCVMRGFTEDETLRAAEAMLKGGVKALEVALNTEGAPKTVASLRANFGNDMLIGAGTILTPSDAECAVSAGAVFLLAPNLDEKVMDKANSLGVAMLPGTFTATEILQAHRLGAEIIKLFPVSSVGTKYLKDILGPYDFIELMPMGGVTLDNADDFMRAGAVALGLGSSLVKKESVLSGKYEEITENAKRFSEIVGKYRK